MNKFAGNLPRNLINSRLLGSESTAYKLLSEREAENSQIAGQMGEVGTVMMTETTNAATTILSVLPSESITAENVKSRVDDKDCDLTVAKRDCAITSREGDAEDLSALVSEKTKFLSETGLEHFWEMRACMRMRYYVGLLMLETVVFTK